ncbi:MAG: Alcohol dehydrogenase, partial [uncultured Phycisphaerae bacterium]
RRVPHRPQGPPALARHGHGPRGRGRRPRRRPRCRARRPRRPRPAQLGHALRQLLRLPRRAAEPLREQAEGRRRPRDPPRAGGRHLLRPRHHVHGDGRAAPGGQPDRRGDPVHVRVHPRLLRDDGVRLGRERREGRAGQFRRGARRGRGRHLRGPGGPHRRGGRGDRGRREPGQAGVREVVRRHARRPRRPRGRGAPRRRGGGAAPDRRARGGLRVRVHVGARARRRAAGDGPQRRHRRADQRDRGARLDRHGTLRVGQDLRLSALRPVRARARLPQAPAPLRARRAEAGRDGDRRLLPRRPAAGVRGHAGGEERQSRAGDGV